MLLCRIYYESVAIQHALALSGICRNWEGFTPEDLARKQRNDEVNAFLRKEREKLEQTKQKSMHFTACL